MALEWGNVNKISLFSWQQCLIISMSLKQVLNSPWDVSHDAENGFVYIAMAGQHQIWRHRVADGVTEVFSGDGYERNLNGRR